VWFLKQKQKVQKAQSLKKHPQLSLSLPLNLSFPPLFLAHTSLLSFGPARFLLSLSFSFSSPGLVGRRPRLAHLSPFLFKKTSLHSPRVYPRSCTRRAHPDLTYTCCVCNSVGSGSTSRWRRASRGGPRPAAAHRPGWCQRGTRQRQRALEDGVVRCAPDGDSYTGGSGSSSPHCACRPLL
jgi:hypothetical protein